MPFWLVVFFSLLFICYKRNTRHTHSIQSVRRNMCNFIEMSSPLHCLDIGYHSAQKRNIRKWQWQNLPNMAAKMRAMFLSLFDNSTRRTMRRRSTTSLWILIRFSRLFMVWRPSLGCFQISFYASPCPVAYVRWQWQSAQKKFPSLNSKI